MAAENKSMTPLGELDYTKIDYQTIVDDITSQLRAYPQYQTEWQDFLSSNAGKMLLESFSYIATKIILRADLIANELFLSTAEDSQSIVNILKLIGYNLTPPSESEVFIKAETINGSAITDSIGLLQQIRCFDLSNQQITFEIMNDRNDYNTVVTFDGESSKTIKAYAGTTIKKTIKINSKENFTYTFDDYPIINGSFQAYLEGYATPLEEVTSLVLFDKDSLGRPRYVLSFDSVFRPTITFGKEGFGGAFDTVVDGVEDTYLDLTVYFRIGGGYNSNIIARAISQNVQTVNGKILKLLNETGGLGGADGQTPEEAKRFAPLTVKTVNKTVTPEDYTTLLLAQNTITISDATIDSPYENPEKVPYLFNYIYISPQRNFDDFTLETEADNEIQRAVKIPEIKPEELTSDYVDRFKVRLNNFINIKGASDFGVVYTNASLDITEYGYSNEFLFYPNKDKNDTDYTEEAYQLYYNFLADKKITGIENIFRIATFNPFKIDITVYYEAGFNPDTLRQQINDTLRAYYSLDNCQFNNIINVSKIYELVHLINGVSYCLLNSPTTNLTSTKSSLNFVLHSTVANLLPEQAKAELDITIRLLKV